MGPAPAPRARPRPRTALLAAALALCASPALAAQAVSLGSNLVAPDGPLTLGEIFEGAGAAAPVVVARLSGPSVVLDADAVQAFALRHGLDWANPRGIQRIIVRAGPAASLGGGRGHEVLTYGRSLSAGELVQAGDLLWARVAEIPVDAPLDAAAVVGEQARRPLRQGDAVSSQDLAPPIVIKAGDAVLVTYADGGITLTLQAKAMASAAAGDTLNVLNTASRKLIEAVATGPGQAVVGPQALRLRTEHASTDPRERGQFIR
ncbi:MAG TPA: flagellar basal body P-ring formation chaperone FlgA [Caulobacteraceae bacterium]|nr:flagellar basal body P-ring formation chaperone FlgA [Caulobacteraceae bacterium]